MICDYITVNHFDRRFNIPQKEVIEDGHAIMHAITANEELKAIIFRCI